MQNDTITLINDERHNDNHYYSEGGKFQMKREIGKSPDGISFNNYWVLRDGKGKYIDHGQYRNDLARRHNMKTTRI